VIILRDFTWAENRARNRKQNCTFKGPLNGRVPKEGLIFALAQWRDEKINDGDYIQNVKTVVKTDSSGGSSVGDIRGGISPSLSVHRRTDGQNLAWLRNKFHALALFPNAWYCKKTTGCNNGPVAPQTQFRKHHVRPNIGN
jgi:hypothetical protein